jgi:dihydrofolate reductase
MPGSREHDLAAEVARIRTETSGDLGVCGATLAASFLRLGLIDEYRLFVRPIVLGGGRPYFPSLEQPLELRLAESKVFSDGVAFLRYERTRK